MKKFITKLIPAALITTLALTGCTSGEPVKTSEEEVTTIASTEEVNKEEPATSTEKTEVSFWTMQLSPNFDDYLNSAIGKFENEFTETKIKWVDVPWGDMESKILTAAASKTMPDIANLNPHFAQKLAQLNALADMNELASDVKDDYIEGAWNASSYEGKIFALPWYLTTGITFYNKDIFEQAGLDPENPPLTYDEMYEMAKTIKEKTGKYGYSPVFSNTQLLEDYEKAGVTLFNEDYTEATYTTDEVKELTAFYKKMFDEDLIPRDALTKGNGDIIQLYSAGDIAIFQGGTSHASMIEGNNIEVYNVTGIGPQLLGEGKGKVNISVMNVVISQDSTNKEKAADFAKFITNDENQVEFSKISGAIVPSTIGSLGDPFFADNTTPKDQSRKISAEQIAKGQVIFPPIKNWNEVNKPFIDAIGRIMGNDEDIETTLINAEEEANQAIK